MKALRVSVGPVKGFISAGRRTRDFWAGSFLLSRLTGEAMRFVMRTNEDGESGQLSVPVPFFEKDGKREEEDTLKAIRLFDEREDKAAPVPGPLVGTLVNHFRAKVPDGFEIGPMQNAVRARFKAIADAVFLRFINPALAGVDPAKAREIRARWEAQTSGNYFEILAVMGDEGDWSEESRWLERRKSFRDHMPIDETRHGLTGQGDRCPIHPELCELGGFFRIRDRDKQDAFWETLRTHVARVVYGKGFERKFINTLEIRKDEHLSALALVKRLFPLLPPEVLSQTIGWVPDQLYGLNIEDAQYKWNPVESQRALRNWPSTALVAAIPWIIEVGRGLPGAASRYALAQYATLDFDPIIEAERPQHHRIMGIDKLDKETEKGALRVPLFAVLDGTLHFERGLEKDRYDTQDVSMLLSNYSELRNQLEKYNKNAPQSITPPSTHYAMLEMDGDSMGEVFSHDQPRAEKGSEALLNFAGGVPQIVRAHDGVLIYAGADDVTAMLPIETAIDCAKKIRAHWVASMAVFNPEKDIAPPTLSASIVFADYQNPLSDVRDLTHERLDHVAKEAVGRDAIAIAVMKSGGVTAAWASCWDTGDTTTNASLDVLFAYAKAASESKTIASRLPYLMKDRFTHVLTARKGDNPLFSDEELVKLLAKELGDSGLARLGGKPEEKAMAVAAVLQPYRRKGGKIELAARDTGGLLVARFLTAEMVWAYANAYKARNEGGGKA